MKKQNGFTLIELLVTSTIIIVLATIGFVSYTQAVKGSRDGKRKADMATVQQALVIYKQQVSPAQYPDYSGNWSGMTGELVAKKAISQPTPLDPQNTGQYVYTYSRPTTTSFCVCARMEDPTKGNVPGAACSGFTTSGQYFCLANP